MYQQSLETDRELGNQVGIAGTLVQLGALAQDTGDYVDARRLYRQGLDISPELGPAGRAAVAGALHQLGTLAQAMGDYPEGGSSR